MYIQYNIYVNDMYNFYVGIYVYNRSDRIYVPKNISIFDLIRFLKILHISIYFAS